MAAPTRRQFTTSSQTSLTATANTYTFSQSCVAGNLIVACLAGDKNTGTVTASDNISGTTGWQVGSTNGLQITGASVCLYVCWKVAVGSETTLTLTTSSASTTGNTGYAEEMQQSGSGSWMVVAKAQPAYNDTARTSAASGTTDTADYEGRALAVGVVDSLSSLTSDTNPTFTNFTRINVPGRPTGSGGGNAGCYVGEADMAQGATTSTTFATNGGSDQLTAAIAAFGRQVTSSAPTVGAGADVTGHAWNTAFSRTATENDNGLSITAREWTITAGPTGVGSSIGTAAALNWTPSVAGNYTLQYAATNSAGTGTDTMTIEVVTRSARFDADGEDYTRALSPALGSTLTILGWIRIAVDRNNWTTFFGLDTGGAVGTRCALQCQSSGTTLRMVAEDTNNALTGGGELTVGTWYAVAVVKTSATAGTVYLGTSAGSLTTTSVTFPSGQSTYDTLRIAESGWGGEWLNGNIAAVRVWNAALNATEVGNELAQYRPIRTANLYAAYQFHAGPSTTDDSPNGRTLSGGSGTAAEAGPSIILGAEPSYVPTVDAGADVASWYANNEFTRTAGESGSGITSRAWTIQSGPTGVGNTIGTAAALTWTPTTTGTYVLRYSATNANGTGHDDMSITVVAQAAPTVGAGADVGSHEVNTQFSRTATESANGSAITDRSWTIESGPAGVGTEIGTAAALTWTPTTTGTYVLEYAATNGIGTGTDQVSVTVTSGPPPTVGAGADVSSHEIETTFTRTASESGSGISAREWKILSGPIDSGAVLATAALLEWVPQLAGVYVLRYSATNLGGTGTDDVSITVVNPYVTPGEILNIGVGAGRNHFSVDIARSSSERELMECEQIEAGLDEDPFFTGTADYSRASFWTQVNAATTSGSAYPRSELREVNPGGSVNAAWDPHDGGTHWIRGRSAATHLMAVKPTLIMAQQHSGDDDVIQIRTQLRSGATHLEVVLNGATSTPVTLVNPYVVDTEFDWMLEILPPINGQTAKGRIYYQSWLEPVHTWLVTDMPATVPGHYYKAGNYLNSNTSTEGGNSSEFGSSTLRNLQHWHTGWAAPDNGFWGLSEVDAGTDISSPSGWTITRTGVDGALEADRVWYVVDGPTGGTDVGQYVGDSATLEWAPTVQGDYRLRYGVTTDVGTNFDDIIVTVTAPVAVSGGFLPFFNA